MVAAVPSDLEFPELPPTDFVTTSNDRVIFHRFAVNRTTPQPEHLAFIRANLVPFFIRQIGALNFPNDNNVDIFLFGFASASGNSKDNLALSIGRATEIGNAIAREFELQKSKSAIAKNIRISPRPKGAGDAPAKANLLELQNRNPQLRRHLSNEEIDILQPGMRSVFSGLKVLHEIEDDDTKVDCRELLTANIKIETVPANHLEKVLDETEKKIPPALKFILNQALDLVKKRIAKKLEPIIKELEVDFPEVAIVLKTIDFAIPTDVKNQFEFRNHRGNFAIYNYTGSKNQASIDILDALAKALSILKWLAKVEEVIEKLGALAPKIEGLELVLKNVTTAIKALEKIEADLENKDGVIRKHLGDGVADLLIGLLKAGRSGLMVVPATEFFPVSFVSRSVFDVSTFQGPARTEVRSSLGQTKTILEFLGAGPEGRLGFGGVTIVIGPFAVTNSLIGFGVTMGELRLAK